MRIVVIGRGRVGRSLGTAWSRSGHRVALRPHDARTAPAADVVLLSVPDRALEQVALHWANRLAKPALVIHAAGALELAPLQSLRDAGHRVGSLHPLAAIPTARTDLRGAFAAIQAAPRDRALLRRLARDAGMRAFTSSVRNRARYHLGAVFAANGQPVLLEVAVAELRRAGIAETEARAALATLAHTAIAAWSRHGGPAGLTGPVARGDAATVRRHLEALSGRSARELYLALSRAALELASRRRPVPQGLAEVARALR